MLMLTTAGSLPRASLDLSIPSLAKWPTGCTMPPVGVSALPPCPERQQSLNQADAWRGQIEDGFAGAIRFLSESSV